MGLIAVGASHRTAPVEVREKSPDHQVIDVLHARTAADLPFHVSLELAEIRCVRPHRMG